MKYNDQYHRTLLDLSQSDYESMDRTGTGIVKTMPRMFYYFTRSYEAHGTFYIPALKSRKVYPRVAFAELQWMLRGSTDVTELQKQNVHIWDGNSTREFLDSVGLSYIKENNIGKAYGYQFRNSNGRDQLKECFTLLSEHSTSRRIMINLWNTNDLDEMALPPCVYNYQFVPLGNTLNLVVSQRSCDYILGQPYNAMFATMFLILMATSTGYEVGTVSHMMADIHMYKTHTEAARLLLNTHQQVKDDFDYLEDAKLFYTPRRFDTVDDMLDTVEFSDFSFGYQSYGEVPKDLLKMAV